MIGVIGSLFVILAPANMKDKLIGVATFATNERQCFNFHKKYFIDPDSAYVDSSYVQSRKEQLEIKKSVGFYIDHDFDKYGAMMYLKVKAKNAMGGYVTENVECPIVSGSFNKFAAESNRQNPEPILEPGAEPMPPFE